MQRCRSNCLVSPLLVVQRPERIRRLGVLRDRAVAAAALLHALAVDTGSVPGGVATLAGLLTAVVVDVLEVESVEMAGEDAGRLSAEIEKRGNPRNGKRVKKRKPYPRMVRQMLTRRSAPQPATA